MTARPFHLGWFLQGSSVQAWGEPWTGHIGRNWMMPELFIDMARCLERACFDYLLIEDLSYVGESYGGSTEIYLANGIAVPRQDPSVVASLMSQVTSRIGIVPTFGTYAYPPYLLARLIATLDQVTRGRIGWNAVTGSSDFAAMNFGMPGMPEHDLRYDMADEYMEVLPAVVGHHGSQAPSLPIPQRRPGRSLQGARGQLRRPVLQDAWTAEFGTLPARSTGDRTGRRLASRTTIRVALCRYDRCAYQRHRRHESYRDDVRARMVAHGRHPDACKVLFLVAPIIGETDAEAQDKKRARAARAAAQIPQRLAHLGKVTNIDFGRFDLDQPLPADVTTNGHQQTLDEFRAKAAGRTLREAMSDHNATELSVELVGTPDLIAARMGEVMEEVGGDGFLFSMPNVSRRTLAEVEDGLVPALQERGLMRIAYSHAHFRDNLLEF